MRRATLNTSTTRTAARATARTQDSALITGWPATVAGSAVQCTVGNGETISTGYFLVGGRGGVVTLRSVGSLWFGQLVSTTDRAAFSAEVTHSRYLLLTAICRAT